MKTFIAAVAILSLAGCAGTPFIKLGVGYKFDEANAEWEKHGTVTGNHPISARIEGGIESGPFVYGISHHSQPFVGPPFNDRGEYSKTEVFVDYKFTFGQ